MLNRRTHSHGWRIGLFAAALAGLTLPQFTPAAFAQQPEQAAQQAAPAAQIDEQTRATLSRYGNFVQHARYGEVWTPTVTPQGWHPYPACNWVRTAKFGWYFDDKTPWGEIVHHYGRWTNDSQLGWIWVPGREFSPGWVVWRTSNEWTGWAPMLPDADIGRVSADEYNTGSQWTFIETQKMRSGCSQTVVAGGAQIPLLLRETRLVTRIEFIDGIAVFALPSWVWLPMVNINFGFAPWGGGFLAQTIFNWNWVWSNLNITINVVQPCGK